MSDLSSQSVKNRSGVAFLLVQILVVGAGVSWAAYRVSEIKEERKLPALRPTPLTVDPLYDYEIVVSEEQLRQVLARLTPKLYGQDTKINNIDHALRCWGVDAAFADPNCVSGADMRRLLLDHRRYVEVYGDKAAPFLIDVDDGGVRVRVKEGTATSSHYDHTIAGLAEVGTPLDFPVLTPTRETNYRAMIEQSLRDFSLNQWEYEWSALAYTLFLPRSGDEPRTDGEPLHWISSEGQRIDFDFLADRIMRQETPQGVCAANHRMHALVMMLRVDDEYEKILTPEGRQRIIEYLQGITQTLVRNQHPDGYWTMYWPAGVAVEPEGDSAGLDPLAGHILATGHPLEWWALAPSEVHPPRPVLAAAGQWLTRAILNLTDEQVEDYYTFLTHAGRALSLWRKRFPVEVELVPPNEVDAPKAEQDDGVAVDQQEDNAGGNIELDAPADEAVPKD